MLQASCVGLVIICFAGLSYCTMSELDKIIVFVHLGAKIGIL